MSDYYRPESANSRLWQPGQRLPVTGSVVAAMQDEIKNRGLKLNPLGAAAILPGSIHELMITTQADAGPGATIGDIYLVGFFTVEQGSVITVGDGLYVGDTLVGHFAGVDEGHLPNHLNMVFKSWEPYDGRALGVAIGTRIRIGPE